MQKLTPFYFWKRLIGAKNPFEAYRVISGFTTYNVNTALYNIQKLFKKD